MAGKSAGQERLQRFMLVLVMAVDGNPVAWRDAEGIGGQKAAVRKRVTHAGRKRSRQRCEIWILDRRQSLNVMCCCQRCTLLRHGIAAFTRKARVVSE